MLADTPKTLRAPDPFCEDRSRRGVVFDYGNTYTQVGLILHCAPAGRLSSVYTTAGSRDQGEGLLMMESAALIHGLPGVGVVTDAV